MRNKWLRFSPFFVMPLIWGLYMYLSIGDYHVPFGTLLKEEEKIVESYDWKGSVIETYPIGDVSSKKEVELLILESELKQSFAVVVLLFFVVLYSILLEWLSRKWKVSLQGVIKIPEKWKPVVVGVFISLYAFLGFMIGDQYLELVQQSETILSQLRS